MTRFLATCCIALATAVAVAVAPAGARAGPKATGIDLDRALFVTSVSPSRGREVLPDLWDPGMNNVITVRFSTLVNQRDLVDDQAAPPALSRKVDFRYHTLAPVSATASVFRNVLTINPFSIRQQVLPPGRYTLTLKPTIRSLRGRMLNGGAAPFTTSFFVGSATTYPPVLRRISPEEGATGVRLRRAIVVTFDEQMDAASASAAVRLEDRSTTPPTPIPARVRLARRGFDVVVTPELPRGYPAGMHVTLVIAGRGTATDPSATILRVPTGHEFTRDAGPSWAADLQVPTLFHSRRGNFDDVSGEFTMTFRTRAIFRTVRR